MRWMSWSPGAGGKRWTESAGTGGWTADTYRKKKNLVTLFFSAIPFVAGSS